MTPRDKVLVSYSHADRVWLARLRIHLSPLEREGKIELWDDSRIQIGADWKEEIARALASARVAVLLISAHFLASPFIANEALPPLLARAESEGTRIIPLIISASRFDRMPSLSRFQAVNEPSSPLVRMGRGAQEEVLNRLAAEIEGLGTVDELKRLATGTHAGHAVAAHRRLQDPADDDDSRMVSAAAGVLATLADRTGGAEGPRPPLEEGDLPVGRAIHTERGHEMGTRIAADSPGVRVREPATPWAEVLPPIGQVIGAITSLIGAALVVSPVAQYESAGWMWLWLAPMLFASMLATNGLAVWRRPAAVRAQDLMIRGATYSARRPSPNRETLKAVPEGHQSYGGRNSWMRLVSGRAP